MPLGPRLAPCIWSMPGQRAVECPVSCIEPPAESSMIEDSLSLQNIAKTVRISISLRGFCQQREISHLSEIILLELPNPKVLAMLAKKIITVSPNGNRRSFGQRSGQSFGYTMLVRSRCKREVVSVKVGWVSSLVVVQNMDKQHKTPKKASFVIFEK